MSPSLIKTLRSGPPPPRVVLLPDGLFFTRTIPVPANASPAEVATQVELAIETLSPFPPAQLYHGFFHPPGSERAVVFAAYRRRFTNEQVAEWEQAELVIPAFAALLRGPVLPGTTVLLPSTDGITALYWDGGPVPARVAFRPVAADASETERVRAQLELTQAAPGNRTIALPGGPVVDAGGSEKEFAFRAGDFASRLPAEEAGSLDVRDKAALASLRNARRRDLMLWRGFVGLIVLLGLLAVGEGALVGSRVWLKSRQALANRQRPVVEKIMTAQSITTRINELSTKRLLPFEMIAIISEKRPETITFLRTSTSGLYALTVEAYTTSPAAVSAYQAALKATPAIAEAEVRDQRTRDNQMSFTLVITFKPDALKPATATP
jgi:hypothetical protein